MTIRERMALELEGRHWKHSGARINAIAHQLDYSEVRHAQVVAHLLERPDAEAEAPGLVRRLRSLRDQRRAARSEAHRLIRAE